MWVGNVLGESAGALAASGAGGAYHRCWDVSLRTDPCWVHCECDVASILHAQNRLVGKGLHRTMFLFFKTTEILVPKYSKESKE